MYIDQEEAEKQSKDFIKEVKMYVENQCNRASEVLNETLNETQTEL